MLYYTKYLSIIGTLIITSDGINIISLWIEGQKYFREETLKNMQKNDNIPIFKKTKKWLDRYFKGEKTDSKEILLKPIGGEFRQIVWKYLLEIPYGQITTYGEIAKKVAKYFNKEKMSAQAVGGAIGHNPISIIIPCHRVVGKNGSLTGYAGGIDIKRKLLEIENVDMTNLFTPKI